MEKNSSELPVLVYAGNSRYCRLWVDYWRAITGDRVSYVPYRRAVEELPGVPQHLHRESVQLVLPDGRVVSGASAIFRALSYAPGQGFLLWLYIHVWGFAAVSERLYRGASRHRSLLYRLTRLLIGRRLEPPSYRLVSWLFLRTLGLIYLIAFISFGTQITGLIGSGGILPTGDFLDRAYDALGPKAYWRVPTWFWVNSTNAALLFVVIAGGVLSLSLILGLFQRIALVILYTLYLSLLSAGQVFTGFQWDVLLVEVGFLAIVLSFFGPWVVWLFRALLFRFMFLSGAVKLLSGDPTWRNLTALNFHYETQPLPTWFGWYAHQLPEWFQRSSVAVVFFVELAVPFLIFAPRRLRFFGAFCIVGLNILIFVTGNYNFFNLIAIALCIFLLDDAVVRRIVPRHLATTIKAYVVPTRWVGLRRGGLALIAAFLIFAGVLNITWRFKSSLREPTQDALRWSEPFRLVNSYGLFATMTTVRPEIIVEGSNDGQRWLTYQFKYKAGELNRSPRWAAPHQPRLDWQMWFAALGSYQQHPWFQQFVAGLLEGSPDVLRLLDENPFPDAPPRFVRATLYVYEFTDNATKSRTGAWWERELRGLWFPPSSLR